MSLRRARFVVALTAALPASTAPALARAQACCAGGSAVTPARLEPHEWALAGAALRAGADFGSYNTDGHYVPYASGDSEVDFEQDLFGAVRVLRRGQVALLVPLVQTYRATTLDGAHFGGGIGDVNLSARYDLLRAGESEYVPGIALLAGVTFPTGTAPESSPAPLAVDATGIGAFQGNLALALEQTFGAWLVNATGIVAARTARHGETLGTQVTLLAASAYSFPNDTAVALALSYAFEGDATVTGGSDIPDTSKRLLTANISVLWPFGNFWRLVGGPFFNPPFHALGANQLATGGFTIAVIRAWT